MLHVTVESDRLSAFARSAYPPSQMVDTAVGRLEFATIGSGNDVPILLNNDAMGTLTSLHSIGERLAACFPDRRIIAWSRPGCGKSPALGLPAGEKTRLFEASEVMPALLDALHVGRIDIVGNGCGAMIGMMFAALFPERVRKVVAIAPMTHAASETALRAPQRRYGSAHEIAAKSDANPGAAGAHGDPQPALTATAGMQAPLLLIQGMNDESAGSAQFDSGSEMVTGPVSWVLLREHGRCPHHDNPDQIVSLIHSHLAAGLSRTGTASA